MGRPRLDAISAHELDRRRGGRRRPDALLEHSPVNGVRELQKGQHHPSARLQYPLGLLQVQIRVLVQQVREDREEADDVRLAILLGDAKALNELEAPFGTPNDSARVLDEILDDVDSEILA